MKTLFIFIIVITYWLDCEYIAAQIEDFQKNPRSIERKLYGYIDSDETPKQHNFSSADENNFYFKDGVENNRSTNGNSTDINTEADIISNGISRKRLGIESKLTGSNEDDLKSGNSIISDRVGDQIGRYEAQTSSSTAAADYNIFDSKCAVKHQTERTFPKSIKAVYDRESVKDKNITILVLDENNKIRNKLSVPILNTSHIIVKAYSNNIPVISDLLPETTATNGKYSHKESVVTSISQPKTIPDTTGKLTLTSKYPQSRDHSVAMTTSSLFPLERNRESLISTSERNSIDFMTENPANVIPLNRQHNNEVVLNNKSERGDLEEHSSFKTALLKIIDDHNVTPSTAYPMRRITNSIMSYTSSISLDKEQNNGAIPNKPSAGDLDLHSTLEPEILKVIKEDSKQITSGTTYSWKINTNNVINTSEHSYIDLKDENPGNFTSLNKQPKEAILNNNKSESEQDLHLSLKPARLEIIEENSYRNKNMSTKYHFVNVYVPTLEFMQSKNSSMQTNEQSGALEENTIKTKLLRIDSNAPKESSITSKPVENRADKIGSVKSIGLNQTTTTEGLGPSKATDSLSQLATIKSEINLQMENTVSTTSPIAVPFTSGQIISQSSSSPRSSEETKELIKNILLDDHSQSSTESLDKFNSMTTTEQLVSSKQTETAYSNN